MRIGIDIDGVLADNIPQTCDAINLRLGTSVCASDLVTYDWLNGFLQDKVEDPSALLSEFWYDPEFLRNAPFMLPALTACRRMAGMLDEIHIVTARSAHTQDAAVMDATRAWLDRYGIPYSKIVHTRDKTAYCLEHKIAYLIEDAPATAVQAATNGLRVFLVDAPYNRDVVDGATGTGRGRIFRVNHIGEVPDLLRKDMK